MSTEDNKVSSRAQRNTKQRKQRCIYGWPIKIFIPMKYWLTNVMLSHENMSILVSRILEMKEKETLLKCPGNGGTTVILQELLHILNSQIILE